MLAHLIVSILLIFQSISTNNKWAACEVHAEFANGLVEVEIGSTSCRASWGFPQLAINEGTNVVRFIINTSDLQKERLIEFKSILSKTDDLAKEYILEQLSIREKLISGQKIEYPDYKKFQEEYVKQIKRLSDRNSQELEQFFN